jgi:ketosteroid isomerase-like protein
VESKQAQSQANDHEHLLRRAYAAFNDRDLDAVLQLMSGEVDWPNAIDGGRLAGHASVREYWSRQFREIDSRVEPENFTDLGDGRLAVTVHQQVRDAQGKLLSDSHLMHVYEFTPDGKVASMHIE